jgi:hypothetical protein
MESTVWRFFRAAGFCRKPLKHRIFLLRRLIGAATDCLNGSRASGR